MIEKEMICRCTCGGLRGDYIDKNMKKMELRRVAGISTNALAKLGKNENVNTGVLEKICHALNCQVADIMEITDVEDSCLKREEK